MLDRLKRETSATLKEQLLMPLLHRTVPILALIEMPVLFGNSDPRLFLGVNITLFGALAWNNDPLDGVQKVYTFELPSVI